MGNRAKLTKELNNALDHIKSLDEVIQQHEFDRRMFVSAVEREYRVEIRLLRAM